MPKTLEIHPAIGIARAGTSDEFFFGPEPGTPPPAKYRDAAGRLKRQAARFRVFECDRDATGKLTAARELTAADAQIEWTVHLANRKGAAPKFANPSGGRRNNATGNDAQDQNLLIDPQARSVTGANQPPKAFDTGKFMGTLVPLGSIRTDGDGRLVLLGGAGKSDSVPPQPNPNRPIQGFADSNNWYDDLSDGPVQAKVKLNGASQSVTAKPAWVIVAPPDFAPEVQNLITLYDVAYQAAIDRGFLTPPAKHSFTRDIQPLLARAVGYQWVNRFSRLGHSGTRKGNFALDWALLADPNHPPAEAKVVLRRMRDASVTPAGPAPEPNQRLAMPRLHDETNSSQVLPLTRSQYAALQQWAAGNFINDLNQPPPPELLPDALDRTALQACSGGAFFPGIEAGRIMTRANLYIEPFRLDATALKPGQITEGNAVPWQADFLACAWEDQAFIGWWPAQRPDHVLTPTNLTQPKDWDRGIDGDLGDLGMVKSWHRLGVVVRQVIAGAEVFVETERDPTLPGA